MKESQKLEFKKYLLERSKKVLSDNVFSFLQYNKKSANIILVLSLILTIIIPTIDKLQNNLKILVVILLIFILTSLLLSVYLYASRSINGNINNYDIKSYKSFEEMIDREIITNEDTIKQIKLEIEKKDVIINLSMIFCILGVLMEFLIIILTIIKQIK